MKRRHFLTDCCAAGATGMVLGPGLLMPATAVAKEFDPFQATSVSAVLEALGVTDMQPSDRIDIEAPVIAENGASVPVVITSTIPGTTEIVTIVSANPRPLTARNRFGGGAVPSVSSRVKMGQTTEVIALVRAADRYYVAKTRVKVTAGGCGG